MSADKPEPKPWSGDSVLSAFVKSFPNQGRITHRCMVLGLAVIMTTLFLPWKPMPLWLFIIGLASFLVLSIIGYIADTRVARCHSGEPAAPDSDEAQP
jgi:hypothetical protein